MKRGIKLMIGLAGCAVLAHAEPALAIEMNPYHAIVDRNVFDLKPPTPPPSLTNAPPPPPPNVKLTGITSILGNKRALFMVSEPAQPGRPPGKEESYILAEGERQGMLEVLQINEKAETVKISNDGTVSTITFDKTTKLPSGPAPAAAPAGVAGGNPGAPHMPTFVNPQGAPGNPGYNGQTRVGGGTTPAFAGGGANFNTAGYDGANSGANTAMNNMPTRDLRTGADASQLPPISPEEQMIMMEVQREQTKTLVEQGLFPPLPPTPLTPPELRNQVSGQRSGTTPNTPTAPNVPMPGR